MSKAHFSRPQEPRWRPNPSPRQLRLTERIKALPQRACDPEDRFAAVDRAIWRAKQAILADARARADAAALADFDRMVARSAPKSGRWNL